MFGGSVLIRINKLGIALACFLPCQVLAQGGILTLDQALEIALGQNLSVANAELDVSASTDELEAIKTRRLPSMDVRGGYSDNLKSQSFLFEQGVWGTYPVIGDVPSQDVSITSQDGGTSFVSANVSQPLSQLYRIGLGVEQNEVKVEMAGERLRMTKTEIASLVKTNYFDILQLQSQLQTTEESVLFYQSLQKLVSNYVEQAVALEYELLDVEARLAYRSAQAVVERNDLVMLKQRFNKLLNRDLAMTFQLAELPEIDPETAAMNLQQAMDLAMEQKPEIAESKLLIKSAELGYDIKKSEYIPDVDLRLRYSRLYGTDFIPSTDAYVGVHAKWEFFDWGRKSHELASKEADINRSVNKLHETEESARISVERSFHSISESRQMLEAARLSEVAAREKLRVLNNQYVQKVILLQDVLDAETELSRASTGYNRAVLAVWKAQAELKKALGEV
jgi:outer membrane protein TolC